MVHNVDDHLLAEESNGGSQGTTDHNKEDIRESLNPSDTVHILFPLSQAVLKLLEYAPETPEYLPNSLSQRLFELMKTSEILWKAPFARHKMVLKSQMCCGHRCEDGAEY